MSAGTIVAILCAVVGFVMIVQAVMTDHDLEGSGGVRWKRWLVTAALLAVGLASPFLD